MGYIIIMAGALICWQSVHQTAISRSTTKVKYISISKAADRQLEFKMSFNHGLYNYNGGCSDLLAKCSSNRYFKIHYQGQIYINLQSCRSATRIQNVIQSWVI